MMRVIAMVSLLLVATMVSTEAQSSHAESSRLRSIPGSLEGDTYLVMRDGSVTKLAGNQVLLFRDSPDFRKALHDECELVSSAETHATAARELFNTSLEMVKISPTPANDSEARRWAQDAADRETRRDIIIGDFRDWLSAHALASAPTGMNAHYVFDSLPTGAYVLNLRTEIDTTHYSIWSEAAVLPARRVRRDLDNTALQDGVTICEERPPADSLPH